MSNLEKPCTSMEIDASADAYRDLCMASSRSAMLPRDSLAQCMKVDELERSAVETSPKWFPCFTTSHNSGQMSGAMLALSTINLKSVEAAKVSSGCRCWL